MIDKEEKFKIIIPKGVGLIISVLMLFINQIFAFIGGTVFFKTILNVPTYMGVFIMALFYCLMIFFTVMLD